MAQDSPSEEITGLPQQACLGKHAGEDVL